MPAKRAPRGRVKAKAEAEAAEPAAAPPPYDFEGNSLGYALRRAQLRTYELYYETLMSAGGLTPAQLTALSQIAQQRGLSQAGLAQRLQTSGPSALRIVDVLEAAGYVRRESPPGDRRSHALVLTPLGTAKLEELARRVRDYEARIAARLSAAERTLLLDLLERVAVP